MTSLSTDALRAAFSGSILLDGDEGFSAFPFAVGAPSLVVRPQTTDDVASALRFASDNGLAVTVRSGGHSAGAYTSVAGGLVLDLSAFSDVTVDGTTVTVGTGALWGDVATTLGEHALALTSGDTKSVGVGGLTLGGGVGWLVRTYGLALDSLRSARLVTATGELVTASDSENPELFWAIRGGGGNLGVVIDFTFEAHLLAGVVHGAISFDTDDLGALLRGYRDALRDSPEELNVTVMKFPPMGPDAPGGPQLHVLWGGADLDEAMTHIQPLLDLPGVTGHDIAVKAYADVLDDPHPPEGDGPMPVMVGNNGWAPDFSDDAIAAIAAMDAGLAGPVLMIRYLRGAFNRVAADDTAFAWRNAEALIISVAFLPPDAPAEVIDGVNAAWQSVERYTEGTYGNFVASAEERVVGLMYPAATRARLAAAKKAWDPTNLFSQNQNVAPAG